MEDILQIRLAFLLTLTIKLIITQFEYFMDPSAIRLIENLAKPS